jgi:AraC-like DNA-binding protein
MPPIRLLADEPCDRQARRLGYSSEFQFSRSFKRFEGVSPTAYFKSMTTKQCPDARAARAENAMRPTRLAISWQGEVADA